MSKAKSDPIFEPMPIPEPTTSITFADAIRDWLKQTAIRVDPISLQGYEILARVHVLPFFDKNGVLLKDVDRGIIQSYINEKYENGRKDGKGGLSATSIRKHKNVIFQTLKEAVINNQIPSNPCQYINLPQMQRYEAHYYSTAQINTLLDCIKEEPLYPLIYTTAVYGLRRSEVLGIKWDSIDFNTELVTIKHTVSKVMTVVEKDKTKNASSYRSFPLIPEIRNLFLELKQQEQENRQQLGKDYIENDYVFKWDAGKPFEPDHVTRKFSQLLAKHKLPHIRFHELRHSCASNLLNMGFNLKEVQEWLGHSSIDITADIYAHLDVTRKQTMASRIGASLTAC
ncbi:MAG: site-specific integrase [Oscillospiraceae bacterium]|jgi:integrase|nr:site-specific integrase [Oscillospiraceae bacterium]